MSVSKVIRGLTEGEERQFNFYVGRIMSRIPEDGHDRSPLEKETKMGVYRDIQAKRLPPNVKVPRRKDVLAYLNAIHDNTGSWALALRSYLCPGSWTSSGGSFRLAEEAGYDITGLMLYIESNAGSATLLEVGAGYAGFKSSEAKGVRKLADAAGERMGNTINAHITNLTDWHDGLPSGVIEHDGYAARDIDGLGIASDMIFSQCAAYFEPRIDRFVAGASMLLNPNGLLVFNDQPVRERTVMEHAEGGYLKLEKRLELGQANGNLYVFRKM
ncbi:MAG: hypothetical protein HY518_05665 [Candidatus Aenigmarchaeota archaeon]|nr:hypothetical protein [Candidatus Aenigmarchaeota archaeon]